MTKKRKKLVVIDAHALIHRAYHALPPSLTSPRGDPLNAVYGFTSVLIKVLKELRPDYVVAAFDVARPTFRHKEFAEYKGTRKKTDKELQQQVPIVKEVLESFGVPVLEKEGFEADDVIGTIVQEMRDTSDVQTVVVTGDLDTLQLVEGDKTVVYTLRKGMSDTVIYDEEKVRERYGDLAPEQLVDYKGLKGDQSDNIPGIPGVGDKTAITLLEEYKTIEGLYAADFDESDIVKGKLRERLEEHKDQALFSKELATIRCDVPISFSLEEAVFAFRVTDKVTQKLSSLGFTSLIDRLKDTEAFETDHLAPAPVQDEVDRLHEKGLFSDKIYKLEKALTPVLRRMEETGFLIDTKVLSDLSATFEEELARIEEKATEYAGEAFNLNSPQEVGRVLFEVLELGGKKVKTTKTGQYSTAAAELEKIKGEHEIVELILRWRELSKLKSTYLDSLPELISEKDGRIHTTFKQFGAATGRLSSENPNVQNIPIRGQYGKEIRTAFVAREGFVLVAADYSQLELRIAAALSKDEKMIATFERGEDIHTRMAAEVFDVKPEEVTKDMRRKAKVLNFGVLYGMGPRAFSQSAEIEFAEAKEFIERYQEDFSGLTTFLEETKEKAHEQGYVETVWGRKRFVPELRSKNPGLRAAGERMAINMPVQGTGADIIKAAMVTLDKEMRGADDAFMILQVHDELVFEIKRGAEETYVPMIRSHMMDVIDLAVPLEVDIAAGPNWGEMKNLS